MAEAYQHMKAIGKHQQAKKQVAGSSSNWPNRGLMHKDRVLQMDSETDYSNLVDRGQPN